MADQQTEGDLTALTVDLLASYVANNTVRAEDLPKLIADTHSALKSLGTSETATSEGEIDATEYQPAVSVRKSLANPEHIISMIDGKPYKSLKRHLSANGLTPESYRTRYNLKTDYPMTAPAYSERRREVAKKLGLGRKRTAPAETGGTDAKPAARRGGRRKAGEGADA